MKEAGTLILMGPRIRIELGRITEIETLYFRPGGGGPNNIDAMDTHKPEAMWFKTIPNAQRATRAELISVARRLILGLERTTAKA